MSANISSTTGLRRSVQSGDVVVPLSEILQKLESQVSPQVLENLLREIISQRQNEVRPGELITAELMNQILYQLASLEARVTRLEGSTVPTPTTPTPVITSWSPLEPRVRSQLEVVGQNFPATATATTLDFEGVFVTHFSTSTTTRLVFEVPPGISGTLPREVTMTVRNGTRSDSARVRVQPEIELPRGQMFVTNVTPALGTIVAGQTFTFRFELDSQTIPAETYRVEVIYSNPLGAASVTDWTNATTLMRATGAPLSPPEILCGPTRREQVFVSVRIPTNARSVNMALRAVSLNNPSVLTTTSGATTITVGEVNEVSDPRTTFTINALGPLARARVATIDGQQGIEVAYGQSENISIRARFQMEGGYAYTAEIESPDQSIWTLSAPVPPTSAEAAGGEQDIVFALTLRTTAPAPGGAHPERRFLVVRARRTNTDQSFVSFLRIPIQGFVRTT